MFVSLSADAGGRVSGTLDGAPRQESILAPQTVAQPMEAMRYLPPGPHKLTVWCEDGAAQDNPAGPVGQELMFNFVEVQPYPD